MLSNVKLKHKLLVLCGVPLVLVVIFALVLISNSKERSDSAADINELMSLATINSALVHELQVERGLTAGYLGSGGDSSFLQRLKAQRNKTDSQLSQKKSRAKSLEDVVRATGLSNLQSKNNSLLAKLSNMRNKIDQQSIPAGDAIGYYTNMNGSLLSVISSIAEIAVDPEIKQQALAYYYFVQAKERAGIERAVLTGVFGSGAFSTSSYGKFINLVSIQDTYLNEFQNLASPRLVSQLKTALTSGINRKLTEYRDTALAKGFEGNFGVLASDWFAAATERINLLLNIEKATSTAILELASSNKNKADTANWTYILLTLSLGGLSLYLASVVIKSINSQVRNVLETLDYCVKNKAFDRELTINGSDEISTICLAINDLLATFRKVIEELKLSSEQLASSSEQNSVAVKQTTETLMEQKEQTYLVATAVEEMTLTIQEVANNTNSTAAAALDAEGLSTNSIKVVNQSIDQIQNVSTKVSEVYELISSLHQSSSEMVGVIDVIKSVAEQTNLLALNAAIEAARAGEQGRGFAVVADEVRTLAQRTQDSTQQIEQIISNFTMSTDNAFSIIEDSQQQATLSVEQANDVAKVLSDIQSSIITINQMATQIATATEEQVKVTDDIGRNVNQISTAADESATAAQQIADVSLSQAKLASDLSTLSASFRA